jgi:hypothetical protein
LRLLLCCVLHSLLLSLLGIEHLLLLLSSDIRVWDRTLVIHIYLLPRHYTRLRSGIALGATRWDHHLSCLLRHYALLLLVNKISHVSHK